MHVYTGLGMFNVVVLIVYTRNTYRTIFLKIFLLKSFKISFEITTIISIFLFTIFIQFVNINSLFVWIIIYRITNIFYRKLATTAGVRFWKLIFADDLKGHEMLIITLSAASTETQNNNENSGKIWFFPNINYLWSKMKYTLRIMKIVFLTQLFWINRSRQCNKKKKKHYVCNVLSHVAN